MPEFTRMIQDRLLIIKALEVIQSRTLGWAAGFGATQYIGLEAGQLFVNSLHQMHEGGSQVFLVPVQAS